jgi:hypothetical protein
VTDSQVRNLNSGEEKTWLRSLMIGVQFEVARNAGSFDELQSDASVDEAVGVNVMPFHGVSHRLNSKHDDSILKDSHGSSGFRNSDCDRTGGFGDFCGRPMSRT